MTQVITHRHLRLSAIAVAFLASGLSAPASAELARQGPVVPAHGYPLWYQDATGLALDLCLPDAIDLEQGNCLLLPADVPAHTAPEVFPSNFADEHFWFAADSFLTPNGGGKAILVLAVEAAFAIDVKPGDQIAFGRIRVKITSLPSDGDYRVIHPYGVLEFPGQTAGDTIFFTDDVGINCTPGDFSCVLKSGVGPFLRPAATPGGAPLPLVVINGKTMIADPGAEHFVTGGPGGSKFRIEGPNIGGPGIDFLETDLFTLMGRVHTDPIPSPLRAERGSYTRNGSGAWLDVFASASAGIGKPPPNLTLSGHGTVPKVMSPDGKGMFWGQTNITTGQVPSQVQVTNAGDVPPTVVDVVVVDAITITEASYDPQARQLTVRAKSSDEINPSQLFLPDFPGTSCDNVLGAVITDLAAPPKDVTVRSLIGGSATVPVVTRQAAPVALTLPDLTAGGDEDQLMILNLAPADPNQYTAGTFRILSQPAHGVVMVDASGNASYMPATNYEGMDSFTYVVADNHGVDSNVATVTLTVYPVNHAPVANPDSATVTQLGTAVINLLANDIDPDLNTGIDPATAVVLTQPAFGLLTVNDGVATYKPDSSASGVGTFTFTYQVADKAGVLSNPATVTVKVQGAETIVATAAEYRADKQRWKVNGTSTVVANQTITVRPFNGTTTGPVIGTTVVGVGGVWSLDVISSVSPVGYNRVRATSPLGGSGTTILRVR
jgi:hypothetical protein